MDEHNWQSPLSTRYASATMRANFSDHRRITRWRRLWIALAEAEQELGLAIRDEQLEEMRAHVEDVDFERAARYEAELRHDVMAHIHAFGDVCPLARPILHLGATSCYVTDNADLIALREGLRILRRSVVSLLAKLREFALLWRELPTLGFTHFQPAQATTVGKRACLWIQDLLHDLEDLEHAERSIRFRGAKGTTGTQASFLELFEGDHERVRELDHRVTAKMGFEKSFAVTGQTYPRQLDFRVCQALSSLAQSAHKFATDLRLLSHRRELEEPFGARQVGSSAMPGAQPHAQRADVLARFATVIGHLDDTAHTAANQWLERARAIPPTGDSSSRDIPRDRRGSALYLDVAAGLVVNPAVIRRNLDQNPLPRDGALMMEGGEGRRPIARTMHEAIHHARPPRSRTSSRGREQPAHAWPGTRCPDTGVGWTFSWTAAASSVAPPSRCSSSWPRSSTRCSRAGPTWWGSSRKWKSDANGRFLYRRSKG
jgi:adenylosuccinate lyase